MKNSYGDRDSTEWWRALERRELLVQQCRCGTLRWAPRAICNICGSFDWDWSGTDGRGSVVSWTVTRRQFAPIPAVPFAVVLVRLDQAANILIPGRWAGNVDGSDLYVGRHVRADFTPTEPAEATPTTLITWKSNQAT
ncbi:Zn-ribbon domain-containing OB-fold protein [Rhodococcus sp. NPDC056960]|jgi:uncharacterized OB-fold protein|uniref:Zn-ribbon domain-containing OB-fold protein n=1 Tax=Rhodococcus sp. NPDC056960 TaxID=3345982 RepID=UPI00363B55DA